MTISFKVLILFIIVFIVCVWGNSSNALKSDVTLLNKYTKLETSKQESINSSDTLNINMILKNLADKFAMRLKELGNTELGIVQIQDLVNSMQYKVSDDEDTKHVKRLSERLDTKILGYLAVLNHSVSLIEDFRHHSKKMCFVNVPCIYISENGSYEEPYNSSTLDFSNLPLSILNLTEGFTSYLEQSLNKNLHYFISEMESERLTHAYSDDFKGDKCLLMDDPHFQRVYLKTVSNEPKQLVLLVDNGGSLSKNQFTIAKSLDPPSLDAIRLQISECREGNKYLITNNGKHLQQCYKCFKPSIVNNEF